MSTKTNNAFPDLKKKLRTVDFPPSAKVLDCFAGNHEMWKDVELERYYPIDKQGYKNLSVRSDNVKIMKSLDLTKFNVIDVDAYGIPTKQLDVIFASKFKGTVYFTFIQSMFGKLSNKLLYDYGFTPAMLGKTQTVFNQNGFDKFKNYLARNGVEKIKYFNPPGTQKYYGLFTVSS